MHRHRLAQLAAFRHIDRETNTPRIGLLVSSYQGCLPDDFATSLELMATNAMPFDGYSSPNFTNSPFTCFTKGQ